MMGDRKGRRGSQPGRSSSTEDAELSRRLSDLDRRLDETRAEQQRGIAPKLNAPATGYGTALRMGGDFVAGIVLGAAIGWGFDQLFGTSPWGLIVFLFLGFGAGLFNVMRSAGILKTRPDGGTDFGSR